MNELEAGVLKINYEMMSKAQLLETIDQKLKYIPLNISILELCIEDKDKIKQAHSSEELLLDFTVLKMMSESLNRKCNPRKDSFHVPLEKIASTTGDVPEEHDTSKLPHEQ